MKKYPFIFLLLSAIIYCSCQTTDLLSIDYLVPADINFPSQIKRVGIVNNVSSFPDSNADSISKINLFTQNKIVRKIYILDGNPEMAANSLAETIAAGNYFDVVVICDSALRAGDIHPRETMLGKDEVNELAAQLNVDLLIALEKVKITVTRSVTPLVENEVFLGTVDAKVNPQVRLYIPNRSTPLLLINGNDTIFWEDIQYTEMAACTRIISDEKLIQEASGFAGTIPVKHMIPYWKTTNRFFYINGSVEMRDAALFVRKNAWERALPLWEKAYQSSNNKKKMRAALNLSLFYEMKDDLEKAEEFGEIALGLSKKIDKVGDTPNANAIQYAPNFGIIYANLSELIKRKSDQSRLNIQMERFKADN